MPPEVRVTLRWARMPRAGCMSAMNGIPPPEENPRDLGISVSLDDGKTFTSPAVVPDSIDREGGSNGGHQRQLMRKLPVNSQGQVVVGNSSRVWLMRAEARD